MAAHILDDAPSPPELRRAFDYKAWGVNVLDLPPGELRAISLAMYAYNALTGYENAARKQAAVAWTEANPEKWEFVSAIMAERMRRNREKKLNAR